MGRKKIEIDIAEVERLAGLGLTQEEIALSLGISERTLYENKAKSAEFAEAIKSGKAKTKRTVTNKLMEKIEDGDLGAIIWYEKTRLGFNDKVVNSHEGEIVIRVKYADS